MRWYWWPALLVTIAVYLHSALTYSHDFGEGLAVMAMIGSPMLAIICPMIVVALAGLRWTWTKLSGREWHQYANVGICTPIAVILVFIGFRQSRPFYRFEGHIVSPAPAGIADLQVRKVSTYSDGSGWFFAFRASPEAFEAMRSAHGLREADTTKRTEFDRVRSRDAGEEIEPEEAESDRSIPNIYRRPRNARYFRGGRLTVVTDARLTEYFVFCDHFRRAGSSGGHAHDH